MMDVVKKAVAFYTGLLHWAFARWQTWHKDLYAHIGSHRAAAIVIDYVIGYVNGYVNGSIPEIYLF